MPITGFNYAQLPVLILQGVSLLAKPKAGDEIDTRFDTSVKVGYVFPGCHFQSLGLRAAIVIISESTLV
jgi:hypothetical protein